MDFSLFSLSKEIESSVELLFLFFLFYLFVFFKASTVCSVTV